ncbi:MAG: hypothetical protein RML35_06405 [Chloroherpetonaceae bacterium]|nr:hypothetical protein [Chloroherpetonaceae bacterium]MDW8465811.1 hypothetical protein [Chloroherpetonaceae bacterium]
MRTIKTLMLWLIGATVIADVAVAQPGLRLGIGGGFTAGGHDVSYNPVAGSGFVSAVRSAQYSGGNINGKLKLDFLLTLTGHLTYNLLTTSSQTAVNVGGVPINNPFAPTGSRLNVLNAAVGLELPLRLPIITPYIGADIGLYNITPEGQSAYTRYGAGIGVGVEIYPPLIPIVFEVEARYRFANLIGREEITVQNLVRAPENALNYVQISAMLLFKLF